MTAISQLFPEHVDITFVAFTSFAGAMIDALWPYLRDRSHPFPTAPSFRGAVAGAGAGLLYLIVDLMRHYL